MIAPRKIRFEAGKRRNENFAFRTYLKCNAEEDKLDEQFQNCIRSYSEIMTVAGAEIAVRCIVAVYRKKTWSRMQEYLGLQRKNS